MTQEEINAMWAKYDEEIDRMLREMEPRTESQFDEPDDQ